MHFDLNDQGLCLISGPTGAGKSTLCDVVAWGLFGITSKNGTVDEVLKWPGDKVTKVSLMVDPGGSDSILEIVRTRGAKANDLYFINRGDEPRRGKDLLDTQRLINYYLRGIDSDTYLLGAYLHEFSQAAVFFSTTAKIRRNIMEQCADLTLAKTLTENVSEYKRETKKDRETLASKIELLKNDIKHFKSQFDIEDRNKKQWDTNKLDKITKVAGLAQYFSALKDATILGLHENHEFHKLKTFKDIKDLENELKSDSYFTDKRQLIQAERLKIKEVCSECGSPKNSGKALVLTKAENNLTKEEYENKQRLSGISSLKAHLKRTEDAFKRDLDRESARQNPYDSQVLQLKEEKNPFSLSPIAKALKQANINLKQAENEITGLSVLLADLNVLTDLIEQMRSELITNTVGFLEQRCNIYLNDYFDAELRVQFQAASSDKIDVEIYKDGNLASYTQLSKGQRQILKLCFGVSVMESVSNRSGTSFNAVFFDEALSGCDENIKSRAFRLLERVSLNHESVFVIDHSESFKSLFNNKFDVALVNGASVIEQTL